jgi:hypothetical protein
MKTPTNCPRKKPTAPVTESQHTNKIRSHQQKKAREALISPDPGELSFDEPWAANYTFGPADQ